jgi:hypothetical protein
MPDEKKLEEVQETIDEARRRTGQTHESDGDDDRDFIDSGEKDNPDDVDNAIAPPG